MANCKKCGKELNSNEVCCPNCKEQVMNNTEYYRALNKEKALKNSSRNSKIAFVLSLLALALSIYCFIASGGDSSEGGAGAVWWSMLFFGYPMLLASVILGLESFTANRNKLALCSLILDCVPLFIQFVLMRIF